MSSYNMSSNYGLVPEPHLRAAKRAVKVFFTGMLHSLKRRVVQLLGLTVLNSFKGVI